MAEINAVIARILRQKDAGIIDGAEAMRKVLAQLQRQVLDELGRASITGWEQYRLRQLLDAVERQLGQYEAAAQAEIENRLSAMWDLGQKSVYQPLNTAGIYTGFNLSTSVLDVLKDFAFHKISGVAAGGWDKIKSELSLGILGTRTPQQVADAIGRNLTDPSVFASIDARAEVITKTEMGRVFSIAAQKRMEEAAKYVRGLKKVWIHAGHPRKPRITHLGIEGQTRDIDEPFNVGGVKMMYPRDPAAPLDEVINCGCDHAAWKEEWGEKPVRKAA